MAITKGITIRFGADSSEVTKALRQINSETKSINTELKAVDKALKLDPSNTVLLEQKQKLLADSISETSKKMQLLKENQEKAEKAIIVNAIEICAFSLRKNHIFKFLLGFKSNF